MFVEEVFKDLVLWLIFLYLYFSSRTFANSNSLHSVKDWMGKSLPLRLCFVNISNQVKDKNIIYRIYLNQQSPKVQSGRSLKILEIVTVWEKPNCDKWQFKTRPDPDHFHNQYSDWGEP